MSFGRFLEIMSRGRPQFSWSFLSDYSCSYSKIDERPARTEVLLPLAVQPVPGPYLIHGSVNSFCILTHYSSKLNFNITQPWVFQVVVKCIFIHYAF